MKSRALFLAALAVAFAAQAVPVSRNQAATAASAWARSGMALGARFGTAADAARVRTVSVSTGIDYHVVPLTGGGSVVMSADTESEPVVLFSSDDLTKLEADGPLPDLLARDARLRARLRLLTLEAQGFVRQIPAASNATASAQALRTAAATLTRASQKAAGGWRRLLAVGASAPNSVTEANAADQISDLRVGPLVTTRWSQSTHNDAVGGEPVYNYYVLEKLGFAEDPSLRNVWLSGCTATAAAQILNYFKFAATNEVGYACQVGGESKTLKTLGGTPDETGVVANGYDFANMVDRPTDPSDPSFPLWQRAIGSLAYDCAVALKSIFGEGLTGAYAMDTAAMYRDQFGYANAFVFADQGVIDGTSVGLHDAKLREKTLYANFDAGKPVQLGIYGYQKSVVGGQTRYGKDIVGHAVVADGYGFMGTGEDRVAYVHVNLGWSGSDDAWYNIPEIDTSSVGALIGDTSGVDFLYLGEATFNLVPGDAAHAGEVDKELLTGRIFDATGTNAVAGATVRVLNAAGRVVCETTTGANGIYAASVPGGADYEVWAFGADGTLAFSDAIRVSKTKGDKNGMLTMSSLVGNVWGIDLALEKPSVRIGATEYPTLDKALAAAVEGDTVEILGPTALRESVTLDADLTILSTNANAYATPIVRRDGARLSVAGGIVHFTNVVFAPEATAPVVVTGDGCVAVSGVVVFDDVASGTPGLETEKVANFLLEGPLETGLTLQCKAAVKPSDKFGRYAGLAPVDATNSAARIVATFGEDCAGAPLSAAASGTLYWKSRVAVDPAVAAAYVKGESEDDRIYYRNLDRLFAANPAGASLVVTKDGARLDSRVVLTSAYEIVAAEGVRKALGIGDAAGLCVAANGSLSVSGVTVDGYTGNGLFVVDGGTLAVRDSAFAGLTGTNYHAAAIAVLKGAASVTDCTISNCVASGRHRTIYGSEKSVASSGGGIYLKGEGCSLTLADSAIVACSASSFGGGVYAGPSSRVTLSGDLRVTENTSSRTSASSPVDNLLLDGESAETAATLTLGGPVTGLVGVRRRVMPFATGAADVLTNAAAAFANDADETQVAAYDAAMGGLVWESLPEGPQEVDPADAVAAVIPDTGATRYYGSLADAFATLTGPATVEVLTDAGLTNAVTVSYAVTLRSSAGARRTLYSGDGEIRVVSGAALAVTNLTFDGSRGTGGLLTVTGGTLSLQDGATVRGVAGTASRDASAIRVREGGVFVLEDGAAIERCRNAYQTAGNATEVGKGGAVHLDHATAYLRGGTITDCAAWLGGGVMADNGSEVHVSGSVRIDGNQSLPDGARNNLALSADSTLWLDGPFTGRIGYSEGVLTATNVFGRVAANFAGTAAEKAASAHNFTRDATGDVGIAVTGGGETWLVWSDALDVNGSLALDGTDYAILPEAQPLTAAITAAATNFVCSGDAYVCSLDGHGFVVACEPQTAVGTYTATATPKKGFAWADGTTTARTIRWAIAAPAPTPTPDPEPDPEPEPEPPAVTNVPTPIAFQSIVRVSETEWALTVTNRVPRCWYRLLSTEDLSQGFVTTGAWEQAASAGAWTTNVTTSGGARFWKAEAKEGVVGE